MIGIKNLEMPKNCKECPCALISFGELRECRASRTTPDGNGFSVYGYTDKRHKDCPLVEIDSDNRCSENKDDLPQVKEIIEYLNQTIGSSYRTTSAKTKTLIRARMREGFTVDDFKTVIDKKYRSWGGDAKMQQYLRPETLFGTKFEGYLNEQETYKFQGNRASETSYQRIRRMMQEGAFEQ